MATIRDVAALAEVSVATVSRVINGKESKIPISEKTRQRVLDAARTLGYEPNYMAKSLAGRRTDTIGLVMYDLAHLLHPNFAQIVHGVAASLSESQYDLTLLPLKGKLVLRPTRFSITSYYRQRRVDGMIVAAQEVPAEEILELHRIGCPFVLLGARFAEGAIPSVYADVHDGMVEAIHHLIALGHRRIAFVNGPKGFRINDDMALGYRQVLTECGLYDDRFLVPTDFTSSQTRKVVRDLLDLGERPTAVVAADDLMAVDVISTASEAGLVVPQDLSVVGFADLPIAESHSPSITTVRVPIAETGRQAARFLLQLVSEPAESNLVHCLATQLIVRESTGPAPGPRQGVA